MGVLVGATKRVRIGTAALIMPYRNPVLLARMLVTLDHFSGGRFRHGTKFLRWRFDKKPKQCDFAQIPTARRGLAR